LAEDVKRMAELLKSGAAMISKSCPVCASPLFKVGKDIICPRCNRPVVIVGIAEDEQRALGGKILEMVESTILGKIGELNELMKAEGDPERSRALGETLSVWLSALEKLRKLSAESGA
jgi:UPF0148 protein